jgi:predicted pyridoxine 5'-phosphate oxidase superfamily flavin-nucleotide-binding protein
MTSPDDADRTFHAGERALQVRAGSRTRLAEVGSKVIRDHMPEQHRLFFAELPMLFVGSLDAEGRPWASILAGQPGFVTSPDPQTLVIRATPLAHDPLARTLATGMPIGLLGIQLETRRRNRMNGTVTELRPDRFMVAVGQSFGNCPQYIQSRVTRLDAEAFAAGGPTLCEEGARLSDLAADMIARADTFFLASAAPTAGSDAAHGVDVSHRGGKPGFVRINRSDAGILLTVPDFRGNFFFNTLGNIAAYPRAGLLFIDFATGDLLTLTGAAGIVWDGPEVASFKGAERLLRVRVERARFIRNAVPLRWSGLDCAAQLARTGTWTG